MSKTRNFVALAIAAFVIAIAAWSYHHHKQTHKQAEFGQDSVIVGQAA